MLCVDDLQSLTMIRDRIFNNATSMRVIAIKDRELGKNVGVLVVLEVCLLLWYSIGRLSTSVLTNGRGPVQGYN